MPDHVPDPNPEGLSSEEMLQAMRHECYRIVTGAIAPELILAAWKVWREANEILEQGNLTEDG